MSVVGIGTDIIEIARLEKMSTAIRDKLAKRVLTTSEYKKYQSLNNATSFLAKRWAGKEATAKALGTGIANGVSFQHMEIQSLPSGQPILVLTGRALGVAQEKSALSWHISLSDEKNYATSFVVLST